MWNFGAIMKAVDAVLMLRDAAKSIKGEPTATTSITRPEPASAPMLASQLEATLTNVVVAALKEAFDRDHARLEMERKQHDDERRRAEEALRLELRRQAGDRELARLRLLAGTALVGWIASLVALGIRMGALSTPARIALAVGWALLLGALGAAFSAQGRVSAYVPENAGTIDAGPAGAASLWLLVAGLGAVATSVLL
jgi:hypothetical protein